MKIKEYQNKTILKGMNLAQIEDWCKENGHSSYRAKQIYQWMYKHGVESAEDMNNISKKLRDDIESHYILKTLESNLNSVLIAEYNLLCIADITLEPRSNNATVVPTAACWFISPTCMSEIAANL